MEDGGVRRRRKGGRAVWCCWNRAFGRRIRCSWIIHRGGGAGACLFPGGWWEVTGWATLLTFFLGCHWPWQRGKLRDHYLCNHAHIILGCCIFMLHSWEENMAFSRYPFIVRWNNEINHNLLTQYWNLYAPTKKHNSELFFYGHRCCKLARWPCPTITITSHLLTAKSL